jgi:hypothetical protein
MTYTISVPFGRFVFANVDRKQLNYFNTQFIKTAFKTPIKVQIQVTFTQLKLSHHRSLEDTFFAEQNKFYVADIKGKLASIDFASLQRKVIQIEADPEFDLYYLYSFILEPLYIVKAASKNILLLHASAVATAKHGAFVFAAWRHTGKTDSILHLANQGYKFLGDDFCVIHNKIVYLYPKKINIFSYNLVRFPRLFTMLPLRMRIRLKFTLLLKNLLSFIAEHTNGSLSKVFYRITQLAEVSTNVKIDPRRVGIQTVSQVPLKAVFSLEKTSDTKDNPLVSITMSEIQQKVSSTLSYELADFFHYYRAFQYFYPLKRSSVVDKYHENVVQLVGKYIAHPRTYQLATNELVKPEVLEAL